VRDSSGGEPSRFLLAFIAGDEKTAVTPFPGQKVKEKMVTWAMAVACGLKRLKG
jgi:hypothetical protein